MVTAEKQVVNLPSLHESQERIFRHPARFKVVCCGRRWGKTLLGVTICIHRAMKGERVWWVAPIYKQALEGWEYLLRFLQDPRLRVQVHATELMVSFPSGGSIQIRTADNPNNLRGAGLNYVVLDEAAFMKGGLDLVLRPALADKQGGALYISTPQHFNHFYDLYERGESTEFKDWASWTKPTWDNPFIPAEEIDAAQMDMQPEDFDQEFGASFTAIGGAVFRLLAGNRQLYLRPMPAGLDVRRTGVGMDWGTTKEHQAAVVTGSLLSNGTVWIRSAWQSESGSANDWYDEITRCKRDYGASFARVDRSQSSAVDHLTALGLQADKGVSDVEARIGDFQGLVHRKAIFFDINGPGVRDYYNRLCAYHRYPDSDPKAGKIVEEDDDDVDAGCYLVSELVRPRIAMQPTYSYQRPRQYATTTYGKS